MHYTTKQKATINLLPLQNLALMGNNNYPSQSQYESVIKEGTNETDISVLQK